MLYRESVSGYVKVSETASGKEMLTTNVNREDVLKILGDHEVFQVRIPVIPVDDRKTDKNKNPYLVGFFSAWTPKVKK